MGLSPFQFATAELSSEAWMGTSEIVKYPYRVLTSIGYVYGTCMDCTNPAYFIWLIWDGGYGKNVLVVEKSLKIF
jgi:hypothetical protein